MFTFAANERVPMTRRYPKLPGKVLRRDSQIIERMVWLWDLGDKSPENIEKACEALFQMFMKEREALSHERYWELLRTVWILSGGIRRLGDFRPLFLSHRPQRFYFSTPEEHKRLREMTFPVRVFRAADDAEDGISWTLSYEYAEKFRATEHKAHIFHRDVNRDEIFALIERNGEEEILIL